MNKIFIKILEYFLALFIPVFIIYSVYAIFGYAPFGNKALTCSDANIQFLDFFVYLKDFLAGSNNLYSFGKTLGGNMFAVITYYLTSPINILVLFFEQQSLNSFFDMIVSIKLSIASCAMLFFLNNRFNDYIDTNIKKIIVVALSISYALSQYALAQSSNIMWLDGMFMLPLILLGVYKICRGEKTTLLIIFVLFSFIFNWYTAGINLLFSFIWFLFEIILSFIENKYCVNIKSLSNLFFKYICSISLGIISCSVILLPTISALKTGNRGTLELYRLFELNFTGNPISAIQSYCIGAISIDGRVSLYCGCFVIMGVISIFLSKEVNKKLKIFFAAFIIFILLLFYFNPFFVIFSLLKEASSYWYRYSYVGIFSLIFIASYFYLIYGTGKYILKSSMIFVFILLVVNIKSDININYIQYTCILSFIIGYLYYLILFYKKNKKSKKLTNIFFAFFIFFLLFELFYAAKSQIQNYTNYDIDSFKQYVSVERNLINNIKNEDSNFYRISQTYTRNKSDLNLTANYNEALAYNFNSISGYTSSPDDNQRNFLEKLGYRKNGDNFNIVNTSIVSADSLLGVKYILSEYDIEGYELLNKNYEDNKKIYFNPFYLPMAFKYKKSDLQINNNSKNPFEYQNEVYSKLIGKKIEIFKKIDYIKQVQSNNKIVYEINIPVGKFNIYGNLPWNKWFDAKINVNNFYNTSYACWLSPSVFYIPIVHSQTKAKITIFSEKKCNLDFGKEQFYALNLDVLKQVTTLLKNNKADTINIKNGKANFIVTGKEEENLYISIPYDKGWKILQNGKKINPELFDGCMYSIKLLNGVNNIYMEYKFNYLKIGLILSLIGLVGIIFIMLYETRKK